MKPPPGPLDRHVGQRIRSRRRALSLSQAELGKALAVSFQQVGKYESGVNQVSPGNLQKIAEILQVGPGYFFDGAPKEDEPVAVLNATASIFATKEGLRLARAFAAIRSHALRAAMVAAVEAAAQAEAADNEDHEPPAEGP